MFQVDNLNKTYGSGSAANHVLNGISFNTEDTDILSITGVSGSGKTTLLSILAALDSEFEGRVMYNGIDLSTLSARKRRSLRLNEFGFVFQSFHLISTLSVHENIILAASEKYDEYDKKFYDKIVERCGLNGKLTSFPSQLSGGEQQRVAIARALLLKPNVIFADEPTGNLDTTNAKTVFNLLSEYSSEQKCSFIYVTHEHEYTSFANKHIALRDGSICGPYGD